MSGSGLASGVRVVSCESWVDFIAEMRAGGRDGGGDGERLYLGQAARGWTLASEFERRLEQATAVPGAERLRAICDEHLAAFQESAAGLLGNEARTFGDDDWWALGRHHGLNTPLLDWSRSPYVSAFFAFSEHLRLRESGVAVGDTVAVWALSNWRGLLVPGEFELVAPRSFSNPRQRAQRGVFTRLTHQRCFDLESYLAARSEDGCLTLWEVPAVEAAVALDDLRMANITPGTLFPDLNGAATEANAAYEAVFDAALGGLVGAAER